MRNVAPETIVAEGLDAILADLRTTLAGLPRPAGLIEAETRLIATREARATAWDTYRAAIGEQGRSLARDPASEAGIHRKKALLDAAERHVIRAQRDLVRHREVFGETISPRQSSGIAWQRPRRSPAGRASSRKRQPPPRANTSRCATSSSIPRRWRG